MAKFNNVKHKKFKLIIIKTLSSNSYEKKNWSLWQQQKKRRGSKGRWPRVCVCVCVEWMKKEIEHIKLRSFEIHSIPKIQQ